VCVCAWACACVRACVCECVCAGPLVRLHRRLGGLCCRRFGRILCRVGRRLRRNRLEPALPPPCRARPGSVCLQCVPQHTRPTRGSRSSADAAGDAAGSPAGDPGGAAAATACAHYHGSHEPSPQLMPRAGLRTILRMQMALPFSPMACRQALRLPATQPRGGTRPCEAVRGTWGTRSTHRYCEGLACSVT
jgi:hypothetical protein